MSALARAWERWERFWFEPMQTSTLAIVRIGFGVVALAWTLSFLPQLHYFFSHRGVLPEQPAFGVATGGGEWGLLEIFPGNAALIAVFLSLVLGCICLTLGYHTRLAALVVFVGILALERRNPFVFNSGDALLRVTAFYLMLASAGASLSLDRLRRDRDHFWDFPARAPWALRLIQVQVSVIYVSTVWAKARGVTWNDGTATSYAFRVEDLSRFPVPHFAYDSLLVVNLLTYGTLAVELGVGILVWNRVLRPWILGLGILLHLSIDYTLRVGFFSYAILVLYLAFLPPELVSARVIALRDRLSRSRLGARIGARTSPAAGG